MATMSVSETEAEKSVWRLKYFFVVNIFQPKRGFKPVTSLSVAEHSTTTTAKISTENSILNIVSCCCFDCPWSKLSKLSRFDSFRLLLPSIQNGLAYPDSFRGGRSASRWKSTWSRSSASLGHFRSGCSKTSLGFRKISDRFRNRTKGSGPVSESPDAGRLLLEPGKQYFWLISSIKTT